MISIILHRWIELFGDYNCEIRYHPGKANVVADALSRKERVKPKRVRSMNIILQSSIKDRIQAAQKEVMDEFAGLQKGLDEMIEQRSDETLYYLDRIWVPLKGEVRTLIMDEAHKLKYFVHPGADKMYYDLKIESIRSQNYVGEVGEEKLCDQEEEALEFSIGLLGPFEIIKKVGPVAYQLDLPEELNGVYDTLHVSNLKKYLADPTLKVPLDEIRVDAKLNFVEEPIKDRLKAARDRQKSYADKRRKPLEFSIVGPVAYQLDLPEELNGVYDTLHVSNLKKYLADPTLKVPLDEIRVDAKLNFVEEPVEILDKEFKKLKRSRIAIVKVRWNSKRGPEFTWEREDQMKLKYPHLFSNVSS
ncbi:hypothetical protein Tco_0227358 [Tanacetum coccineum]